MDEAELIKKYFKKLSSKSKNSLNLKDDVYFDKKKNLAVTVDTYIEGIHFLNFKQPKLVIKKIIRSSISDLYAKGVKPKSYFISASGNKKNFSKKNLLSITNSLNEEQKRYNIFLGGGDTVFSNKLSFTITSIGYAKDIIYRNKSNFDDDIYVSGNLGDSYAGLLALKNKIKIKTNMKKYFIDKYFKPEIQIDLSKQIVNLASSSIDISDGLIGDLEKMIDIKKLSYKIFLNRVPISNHLKNLLKDKKLSKINFISKGDDYQILFTAKKTKRNLIKKISSKSGIKITHIGVIQKKSQRSSIIDANNDEINLKNKGYLHLF